ncbi:activity-dependent neuroprotector homeobox protein 2 isoform X2 [Xenopus laevis]|uniref:Activity-dependent neuroprotector homeobox protein 2 isoform X2 n=1 Tax=Xenopus laevis TaxID=8355 RepID=A0A8J0T7I6_XENLA|nr:activity-dependent neuroprotector homeobox protein 2 isoform X2 [Xenopus laevis]
MFQPPVNSLEKIRKARKRVKQILLQIGLESCRELLEDYRSKTFCCSLCKFSTKLLSSFKSHLKRYHDDEREQELMATCPSCPFTSQSTTVVKHMRIFHSSTRKNPSNNTRENVNVPRNHLTVKFSCTKCPYTDTLYYSMKKHVLMTHYEDLVVSFFGEKTEEDIANISLKSTISFFKLQPVDKFYCKKCNSTASSYDRLVYHILTSEKHRDLEQKLRADISETSREQIRKMQTKQIDFIPKKLVPRSNAPITINHTIKLATVPQNGPSQAMATSITHAQNAVPPLAAVATSSGSLTPKSPAASSPNNQVKFITASLPQNPNITLQASLPQQVFVSQRFPVNQPVATVLPPGCIVPTAQTTVRSAVLPTAQTPIKHAVLPMNQTLPGGLLPVNQPAVLACPPQTLQPNIINMNQAIRSAVFPVNQSDNSAQNTFLTAPIFRQLIPTGKQVNGIPTYTLAPISVTLPVAPCPVPAVNPPKAPVQNSQPDKAIQVSLSPAVAPSPPVAQVIQTPQQKSSGLNTPGPFGKETKIWKMCPVCDELFPSNVYEVHMQIAHVKGRNAKVTPKSSSMEMTQCVTIAAQASFLKVLKENCIRCLSCRCLASEELLKHLLMHGMVCLYCKAVFHELKNFVYHMKIMHLGKKKIHPDFSKKGFEIPSDVNGNVHFHHFDFNFKASKDELGDKDINLVVVTGTNSAAPIYIKIQNKNTLLGDQPSAKCPFCNCGLSNTEGYEAHLKDRHHIMPTVHTILKMPAFKCVHCCGVYTGSMTLSAVDVHLLRCRNAPKDSSSGMESTNDDNVEKGMPLSQAETKCTPQANIADNVEHELPVPSKRRKVEVNIDSSESHEELSLDILALVPNQSETSYDYKKDFLVKYFNARPYPSKKEIELLSRLLDMWKSDVASCMGTRRYMCMKALKNHKQRVLLGFQMSELKKVKHNLDLNEDY